MVLLEDFFGVDLPGFGGRGTLGEGWQGKTGCGRG